MKFSIHHPTLGEISYIENFWTSKKQLYVNDVELIKQSKSTFLDPMSSTARAYFLKGNFLSGVTVTVENEIIEIVSKPKWYEAAMSIFIFALILVWGNTPLSFIFPMVGGVIGGAISGLMAATNLFIIKKQDSIALKILISLGMTVATVLICSFVAFLIIGMII